MVCGHHDKVFAYDMDGTYTGYSKDLIPEPSGITWDGTHWWIMTYTGDEIVGEHIVVECSDTDAFDLIEPDTLIMAGVELLSKTATGKVFGILCDLHYQADREVTLNKSPNFYGV